MVASALPRAASADSVASPDSATSVLRIETKCRDEGNEKMTWAILFGFLRNKFKIGFLAFIIYAALC